MKISKILYISAIILVTLGCGLLIAAVILEKYNDGKIADYLMLGSSVSGTLALAVLILKLVLNTQTSGYKANNQPKVVVKVLDVKDLPPTPEEKLYQQYENLYKQKLITKEDLDNKRKELLGK